MPRTKQVYLADYSDGSQYSGGVLVVIARSKEQAERLINEDKNAGQVADPEKPYNGGWKVRNEPEEKLRPGMGADLGVVAYGSWGG